MTASALGVMTDTADLVLQDVTCNQYTTGITASGTSTLTMDHCVVDSIDDAMVTTEDAVLRATDTVATSSDPAWDIQSVNATLDDCSGQGLLLGGSDNIATGFNASGICAIAGMVLTGERNTILGGRVAVSAPVGILSDDAYCGRIANVEIHAGDGNIVNLSDASVVVSGVNEFPEVLLDGIDMCGPGSYTVETYGCNTEGIYDCAGDPCESCPDPECYDPEHESDSPCTDPDCWPPPEERLPQLFSYCTNPAAMWDVTTPIKTSRSASLTFRELTAGATSNVWSPNTFDCLVEAVLHVWTDDYGSTVGDTEILLWDDEQSFAWTITCPAADNAASMLLSHDLFPTYAAITPGFLASQIRAELVTVTTPGMGSPLEVGVTLRFP